MLQSYSNPWVFRWRMRPSLGENTMRTGLVFGTAIAVAGIAVAITTQVVAQEMMENFYIVEDAAAKNCVVVDIKPNADGVFSLSYDSRALAEAALAKAAASGIHPSCGSDEIYG
jgi:hypothetical protein